VRTRALLPGERIAVVATSGPVSRERVERGIATLRRRGHPVDRGLHVLSRHGYLAGSDEERAEDLNAAIARSDRAPIFFARGGWGTARILDRADLRGLRSRPRVLLGYSDLTSLFMALQRPGRPYPVRYGPSVSDLGDPSAYHRPSLEEALYLRRGTLEHPLRSCRALRAGRGRGPLLGGCLTLLVGLLGTRFDIPWDGCVLFWEEVNEEPYRLDRMLTQLRLAGKLDRLAGMIVGRLAGCRPGPGRASLGMEEILLGATAGTHYPIVTGFPSGHVRRKRTLLLGVPATLDTARAVLRLRSGG
jgi:muramoyltetrapeptide carboxypeptidase